MNTRAAEIIPLLFRLRDALNPGPQSQHPIRPHDVPYILPYLSLCYLAELNPGKDFEVAPDGQVHPAEPQASLRQAYKLLAQARSRVHEKRPNLEEQNRAVKLIEMHLINACRRLCDRLGIRWYGSFCDQKLQELIERKLQVLESQKIAPSADEAA